MNSLTFNDLPGEVKMAVFLAVGVTIAIVMLKIPEKTLQNIGKLRRMSPNWISFWRLPIFWIGICIYLGVDPFIGFCIVVFALMLDRLDGAVADALDLLNDPEHPGKTTLGEWFDPFIDKLTFPPLLCIFWFKGYFWTELMIPMLIIEVISTIIRPPVMPDQNGHSYVFTDIEHPFILFLKIKIRSGKSSGPGKIKVFFQCMAPLACMPLDQHWMEFSLRIVNGLLVGALVFGVFSVASRFKISPAVDSVVDTISAAFARKSKA